MSSQAPASSSTAESGQGDPLARFGPNEWLVDEIYQQYLDDKDSVDPAWWDFFADYQPSDLTLPRPVPAETSFDADEAGTGRGSVRSDGW